MSEEAKAIQETYTKIEAELQADLIGWARRLQEAGWTGSFGMSAFERIRDELFYNVIEKALIWAADDAKTAGATHE